MNSPREHVEALSTIEPLAREIVAGLVTELAALKAYEAASAKVAGLRQRLELARNRTTHYPLSAAINREAARVGLVSLPGWVGEWKCRTTETQKGERQI